MNPQLQSRRKKGFVILTGGMMLTFTIPIIGLAIDAGFLFAIKARLQSASDAAALAAARSLAVGLTIAEQEGNARARAEAFFNANYPNGMMNTTTHTPTVDIAETAFRTRTVTVTTTAEAPLFFMRIFRSSGRTNIAAMGKASRRDVNVILVLDRSASMNSNGGCPAMRAAAKGFVDLFANQRDRLGMITYGISYALTYAPTMTFKTGSPTLPATIDTITCAGGTGAAQGLFQGYQQILNINEPGALNVIIFFTDGIPNTITASFPINKLDTTRAADGGPSGSNLSSFTNKSSRCYDYQHSKRWYGTTAGTQQASWDPSTEVIRGALYAQEGMSVSGNLLQGITPYVASGFADPSGTVPEMYLTAANASSGTNPQNNSTYNADCWFRGGKGHNGSSQSTGTSHIQWDIAYMPDTDLYGTSLTSPDNFRPVTKYTTGPYVNKISVNDTTNMMNATIVALDNTGARIRNNALASNINTVVYTIGLADVASVSYGHTLLKRVANDPTSPIYDGTRLSGLYTYAPTAADLNAAFVRIAAEILRIAQ